MKSKKNINGLKQAIVPLDVINKRNDQHNWKVEVLMLPES